MWDKNNNQQINADFFLDFLVILREIILIIKKYYDFLAFFKEIFYDVVSCKITTKILEVTTPRINY